MGIANPEEALTKLREFLHLQQRADIFPLGEVPRELHAAIDHLEPLIKEIAGEERVADVAGLPFSAMAVTNRLIGTLERREEFKRILAPRGPALAARELHPWVWHAAVNLWDSGHYKQAVNASATAVEEQTQLKMRRGDLSGAPLYTEAFKVGKVGETSDGRRLRFKHLDELTEDGKRNQSWVSAHEGAMHFGRGCAQGIRNLNAHGTGELPEQEALEYLAALSVLARWVDECD